MNDHQMPETAKVKKVNEWGFGPETVDVRVQEREETWTKGTRIIDVWKTDGTYLGYIESDPTHQTQRHLYGNVASFGKPHTAWFPAPAKDDGPLYWNANRSQAEAIRSLINYAR